MKRLMRVTVVCCMAMVLLCLSAGWVGGATPKPDFIPGLAMCNGVPCYLGITLNISTWQEAKQIFEARPDFTLLPNSGNAVEIANGPIHYVVTYSDEKYIFEIDLMFRDDALAFYSLLLDLGIPCGVQPAADPSVLGISFRDRAVWVKVDDDEGLQPTSPVGEIDLGAYESPTHFTADEQATHCRRTGDGSVPPKYTWRGFRQYP